METDSPLPTGTATAYQQTVHSHSTAHSNSTRLTIIEHTILPKQPPTDHSRGIQQIQQGIRVLGQRGRVDQKVVVLRQSRQEGIHARPLVEGVSAAGGEEQSWAPVGMLAGRAHFCAGYSHNPQKGRAGGLEPFALIIETITEHTTTNARGNRATVQNAQGTHHLHSAAPHTTHSQSLQPTEHALLTLIT